MGRYGRSDDAARRLQHRRQPRAFVGRQGEEGSVLRHRRGGRFPAGKDCTPYTIHYGYDTTALANGTAKTILEQGGKSWFFLTADYAFGAQLENGAASVVKANGGTVVGDVRVPLGTSDFASYLLQAQGSAPRSSGSPTPAPTRPIR